MLTSPPTQKASRNPGVLLPCLTSHPCRSVRSWPWMGKLPSVLGFFGVAFFESPPKKKTQQQWKAILEMSPYFFKRRCVITEGTLDKPFLLRLLICSSLSTTQESRYFKTNKSPQVETVSEQPPLPPPHLFTLIWFPVALSLWARASGKKAPGKNKHCQSAIHWKATFSRSSCLKQSHGHSRQVPMRPMSDNWTLDLPSKS